MHVTHWLFDLFEERCMRMCLRVRASVHLRKNCRHPRRLSPSMTDSAASLPFLLLLLAPVLSQKKVNRYKQIFIFHFLGQGHVFYGNKYSTKSFIGSKMCSICPSACLPRDHWRFFWGSTRPVYDTSGAMKVSNGGRDWQTDRWTIWVRSMCAFAFASSLSSAFTCINCFSPDCHLARRDSAAVENVRCQKLFQQLTEIIYNEH